jgi:hypothetical protein
LADERIGKFYSKCRPDLLLRQTATIEKLREYLPDDRGIVQRGDQA